ncbi:ferritin-like domain-containing protein [Pseudomonas sp. MTM4]|uniref:ferritin-like domain-containing protein n=1 Tax=unclassified Pseudomonas TaxID=196821 RepID=UPI0018D1F825|nr:MULTISPECIES: ferritin-like domain-containing protein [unclassified Pseudomonas]MBC8648709.1 ferritin-like domain-containing protein [Pseudomonas sp. MT4]QXY92691.1 ferritin-like domain-containing protein [Pseudomonas sp. MTM4]
MATAAKLGTNFTGVQMSPKDTKSLLEAVEQIKPDVPGDSKGIMLERVKRAEEADRIGSVPVPGSAKGMLKSTFDMALGKSPELLVDKLGERLAFERSGVRLYDAMIAKAKALGTAESDLIQVLQHIRDEEFEHMNMVAEAIETLGADPTAQTPCADVAAVKSMGVMQVLTDPRTNIAQGMGALLTIELEDNAAWELLIELAEAGGHPNIAKGFKKAKDQEDDHLVKIKTLIRRDLIGQIK